MVFFRSIRRDYLAFFVKQKNLNKGGTMAEYAVVALIIILAVIGALMLFGINVRDLVIRVVGAFS
jgi:Flp pilus assembly pilin Flp